MIKTCVHGMLRFLTRFVDFLDHVVVCAGEKQTITCPSDTNLNIASANYGYDSNSGCPIDSGLASESCQATGVYPVVRSACHGQASCLLQSDGQEFGGMCPGNNNFLKVGYSCQKEAPSLSNSESTTPSPVTPRSSKCLACSFFRI